MSSSSAGQEPPAEGTPDPTGPSVTVAGIARRLGVASATLRTWDRRYGLGPSEHAAGAHRRYTPTDVARLEHMRRLVLEGVAPADAARAVLATPDVAPAVSAAPGGISSTSLIDPASAAVDHSDVASGRGGGGGVVPMAGGSAAARGLARAAMGLDAGAVEGIVAASMNSHGIIATWNDLLVPVLVGVGRRYEATGRGVDVEHLLSESISTCLRSTASGLTRPRNLRPVLLAGADEEQHTLPLFAVAAALAERQIATRMLGARVPRGALAAALRRSGPIAVMVWAHMADRGDVSQLEALPALRPAPLVLVGGPGWPEELPTGVARATSLEDAVDRLFDASLV